MNMVGQLHNAHQHFRNFTFFYNAKYLSKPYYRAVEIKIKSPPWKFSLLELKHSR